MICLLYDKNKHKPDESFSKIPDLTVIDGGKGQLSVANKVFAQFKLDIPHIALAKEMEEIFVPQRATIKDSAKVPNTRRQENFDRSVLSSTRGSKFSDNTVDGTFAESLIKLPSNNEALKLIQRARNEAHRFAISFNQQLRSKKMFAAGET